MSRAMRDAVAATGHRVRGVEVKAAVRLGYLSTLKHLHRQGRLHVNSEGSLQKCFTGKIHEIEATVLHQEAAAKGQLEVLKWLRANGCPWDEKTCASAAQAGHLEVLQWARANGCPWDAQTCSRAAWSGHLEIMQWARANGCPWDVNTHNAARGHMLEWALANGVPTY